MYTRVQKQNGGQTAILSLIIRNYGMHLYIQNEKLEIDMKCAVWDLVQHMPIVGPWSTEGHEYMQTCA